MRLSAQKIAYAQFAKHRRPLPPYRATSSAALTTGGNALPTATVKNQFFYHRSPRSRAAALETFDQPRVHIEHHLDAVRGIDGRN